MGSILVGTCLRKELHYQAQAKEPVPGYWLQVSLPRSGFFFMDLQRMRKININDDELVHLQGAANRLMNLTDHDIEKVILTGELKEFTNNA